MGKKPQKILFIPGAALVLLCALLAWFWSPLGAAVALGVCILLFVIAWFALRRYQRRIEREINDVMPENQHSSRRLLQSVNIPCVIFDQNGNVTWRNDAFADLFAGEDLRPLLPKFDFAHPEAGMKLEYNGNSYQVKSMPVERREGRSTLTFQYWLDRTEAAHYRRLYDEQLPCVALIYVDNYEELTADVQFQRNAVLSQVEQLVSELSERMQAVYRRHDNTRFLLVFERKYLEAVENARFDILNQAHTIETGTQQRVTLSIAVGLSNHIAVSDEQARQAMELALGRGGDQAVIKDGANYRFYGGKHQGDTQQSRVRVRLFARALHQLMETAGDVYIMGHKVPDMDCLGAALGLLCCARSVGCKAHVIVEESNAAIEHALQAMGTHAEYNDVIVTPDFARASMRAGSALIVVDTQRAASTIAPDLISRANKLVLIDHHRRSADYIDNATLNYLDARASSVCEMVTEVMQYFGDGVRPATFECSCLLAGITVDTKHFAVNTGARTFEAAGYLRRRGADNGAVKLMFQDERETYEARVNTVRGARLLPEGIAIASCPAECANAQLVAAQAADELISIRGVEASFVLAPRKKGTLISGRSLGRINVQIILEALGGGGHLTMAGAQLSCDMEEAKAQLQQSIQNYLKEVSAT